MKEGKKNADPGNQEQQNHQDACRIGCIFPDLLFGEKGQHQGMVFFQPVGIILFPADTDRQDLICIPEGFCQFGERGIVTAAFDADSHRIDRLTDPGFIPTGKHGSTLIINAKDKTGSPNQDPGKHICPVEIIQESILCFCFFPFGYEEPFAVFGFPGEEPFVFFFQVTRRQVFILIVFGDFRNLVRQIRRLIIKL